MILENPRHAGKENRKTGKCFTVRRCAGHGTLTGRDGTGRDETGARGHGDRRTGGHERTREDERMSRGHSPLGKG